MVTGAGEAAVFCPLSLEESLSLARVGTNNSSTEHKRGGGEKDAEVQATSPSGTCPWGFLG